MKSPVAFKYSNMPSRPPVTWCITMALLLDRLHTSGIVCGIFIAIAAIVLIGNTVSMFWEENTDIIARVDELERLNKIRPRP